MGSVPATKISAICCKKFPWDCFAVANSTLWKVNVLESPDPRGCGYIAMVPLLCMGCVFSVARGDEVLVTCWQVDANASRDAGHIATGAVHTICHLNKVLWMPSCLLRLLGGHT